MATLHVRKNVDVAEVRAMNGVITGIACETDGRVSVIRRFTDLSPDDGWWPIAKLSRTVGGGQDGGSAYISWDEDGGRQTTTVAWL
jgi:hypothetical protein